MINVFSFLLGGLAVIGFLSLYFFIDEYYVLMKNKGPCRTRTEDSGEVKPGK